MTSTLIVAGKKVGLVVVVAVAVAVAVDVVTDMENTKLKVRR
jgi:hypothetical protein